MQGGLPTYDIVFIGHKNTGKSTIITRLLTNDETFLSDYEPTVEDNYRYRHNGQYQLNITDTGGEEAFVGLIDIEVKGKDGFVIVYDVGNRDSFKRVAVLHETVVNAVGNDANIVVVGNKIDNEEGRVVQKKEAQTLVKLLGATYVECSALTKVGLDKWLKNLMKMLEV